VLATAALLLLAVTQHAGLPAVATMLILLVACSSTAIAVVRPGRLDSISVTHRSATAAILVGLFALSSALQLAAYWTDSAVAQALLALGLATLAGLAVLAPRIGRLPIGVIPTMVVAGLGVLVLATLPRLTHHIDVYEFMTHGIDGLLHGQNPYSMTYPNIYDAVESATFYGPGVLVDNRVTYGFPYLPTSLLGALPGYLLGDVRMSGALALLLLALLVLWDGRADLRSRVVSTALVIGPSFFAVEAGSFTEPMQVAILGFAALAVKHRRIVASAVLVGLLLATKQYLVVVLPCLWLLRSVWRPRHYLVAVASAAAVVLPFAIVDVQSLWHSVIEFHLVQPFRPDSISWLVLSVNHLGWPPPSWFGTIPLVIGLVVAVGLARYFAPGPAAFVLASAVSTLATFVTSKQAFPNYFCFVGGALLVAALLAKGDDPLPVNRDRKTQESLPREVAEVGDVRRESGIHT